MRLTSRGLVAAVAVSVLAACSSSGSNNASHAPVPVTTTAAPTLVPTTVAFAKATKPLAPSARTYVYSFTSGGRTRSYRLHVPLRPLPAKRSRWS